MNIYPDTTKTKNDPLFLADGVVALFGIVTQVIFFVWWLAVALLREADEFRPRDGGLSVGDIASELVILGIDVWLLVALWRGRGWAFAGSIVFSISRLLLVHVHPQAAFGEMAFPLEMTLTIPLLVYCVLRLGKLFGPQFS